jgi:WD40 repeat protein
MLMQQLLAWQFRPNDSAVGSPDRELQTGFCGGIKVESGLLPACPDAQILACGSGSRTVRLWNRQTGSCLKVLHEHTSWLKSVIFSSNGQVVVSGTDDRLGS